MSMLAEAAGTCKPVAIFEFGSGLVPMGGPWSARLKRRAWGRWLRLLRQRPRAIVNALAIALPPVRVNRARDIRIVQDILIRSGRAVWLGEDISRIRPAPLGDLDRAVARVRALFGAVNDRPERPSQPLAPASGEKSRRTPTAMTGTA
jgi:hypothetical protein